MISFLFLLRKELIMIKNLWKHITLTCGNGHTEEVVMDLKQGPLSLFYACPKYYPENRKEKERACANRLNLVDFEKMLDHMTEKIEKGMDQGIEINLTGYQYRDRKGTQYTVLKHSKDDLKIEVLNRRALK